MKADSMRSALVWIFTLNVCLQILFIPGGDSKPHPRFREKITEDYNPGIDNVSYRYKDDIYDRRWYWRDVKDWYKINTTIDVNKSGNDIYQVPAEILKTAVQSFNRSYDLYHDYEIEWNVHLNKYSRYYVYFHFAEIQKLAPGLRRIINITLNDENILSEPITLEYMKPLKQTRRADSRFSLRSFRTTVPANILTRVHHRCLTPLIGYCNEGTRTALIYEYMTNGDLAEKLSEEDASTLICISKFGMFDIPVGKAIKPPEAIEYWNHRVLYQHPSTTTKFAPGAPNHRSPPTSFFSAADSPLETDTTHPRTPMIYMIEFGDPTIQMAGNR
ncbi:hypothetical protein JHK86_021892 [Glycine max]|nr:hypothetical protein JHK86_021892 [Glycine max]